MRPGDVLGDEAAQKARGEDVVALAFRGALQYVRDLALEVGIEIGIERERPDSLAALAAGVHELRRERRPVGEDAAHPLRRGIHARAGERREVEHQGEASYGQPCGQSVCQDHTALGVGVDDLDGDAVGGPHHFLRLVGMGTDAVLGDRKPRVGREWRAQLRECDQRRECHRAAVHIGVHIEHRPGCGFQVDTAGIEQDALADEQRDRSGAPPAARGRGGTCRCAMLGDRAVVAGGDGEEGVGSGTPQRRLTHPGHLEAIAARELGHRGAVAARVENVRRQSREPAGEIGACGADRGVAGVQLRIGRQLTTRSAWYSSAESVRKLGSANSRAARRSGE